MPRISNSVYSIAGNISYRVITFKQQCWWGSFIRDGRVYRYMTMTHVWQWNKEYKLWLFYTRATLYSVCDVSMRSCVIGRVPQFPPATLLPRESESPWWGRELGLWLHRFQIPSPSSNPGKQEKFLRVWLGNMWYQVKVADLACCGINTSPWSVTPVCMTWWGPWGLA